jgi:hypothetical protein
LERKATILAIQRCTTLRGVTRKHRIFGQDEGIIGAESLPEVPVLIFENLAHVLVELAKSGWIVLLALASQLITFRLLRQTGQQFQGVTGGHEVFDFQNRLTIAAIRHQLPAYTARSRALYYRFFVIDFFFPLFASCFISLVWAALLQRPEFPLAGRQLGSTLPLLAFLPTVFDWGENVCFLVIVWRYPEWLPALAAAGVGFKRLKLVSLFAVLSSTLLLVMIAAIAFVIARF